MTLLVSDSDSTKTLFDLYRDWPFLGMIAGLAIAGVWLFRYFTLRQEQSQAEYNQTIESLWDKHKLERDEVRSAMALREEQYKSELKTREDRSNRIMQELIDTLKTQRS